MKNKEFVDSALRIELFLPKIAFIQSMDACSAQVVAPLRIIRIEESVIPGAVQPHVLFPHCKGKFLSFFEIYGAASRDRPVRCEIVKIQGGSVIVAPPEIRFDEDSYANDLSGRIGQHIKLPHGLLLPVILQREPLHVTRYVPLTDTFPVHPCHTAEYKGEGGLNLIGGSPSEKISVRIHNGMTYLLEFAMLI